MNYYFAAMGDYMDLQHKVTFDYYTRLIHVSPLVTTLNVKVDLYSDMKEWFLLDNRKNRGFEPPIRVIGGDPTVTGQKAGDLYFMQNGWRVVYDPTKVTVEGVLFSDDYDTPWLYTEAWNLSEVLQPVYPAQVASLVTGVDLSSIPGAVRTELETELANMDIAVSTRATQTSVDAIQGDIDNLAITLAAVPVDVWEHVVTGTFPSGSAGERLQQLLSTGNFIALK